MKEPNSAYPQPGIGMMLFGVLLVIIMFTAAYVRIQQIKADMRLNSARTKSDNRLVSPIEIGP